MRARAAPRQGVCAASRAERAVCNQMRWSRASACACMLSPPAAAAAASSEWNALWVSLRAAGTSRQRRSKGTDRACQGQRAAGSEAAPVPGRRQQA